MASTKVAHSIVSGDSLAGVVTANFGLDVRECTLLQSSANDSTGFERPRAPASLPASVAYGHAASQTSTSNSRFWSTSVRATFRWPRQSVPPWAIYMYIWTYPRGSGHSLFFASWKGRSRAMRRICGRLVWGSRTFTKRVAVSKEHQAGTN